jgi:hypothetical protein
MAGNSGVVVGVVGVIHRKSSGMLERCDSEVQLPLNYGIQAKICFQANGAQGVAIGHATKDWAFVLKTASDQFGPTDKIHDLLLRREREYQDDGRLPQNVGHD